MTTYTPTIEELKNKPRRELLAIFRQAAAEASSPSSSRECRQAAAKIMETVRRGLCLKPLGP